MRRKSLFLQISLFVFCFGLNSYATNYYVSFSGSDSNTGTSPASAWQTISKVNSSMSLFKAGDSILFQREGTYRGQITVTRSGSNNNNIVFGAYGSGENPIISGTTILSGWTLHSGNIYKTTNSQLPAEVRNFFAKDIHRPLSRFPNTGYLKMSSTNGYNTIVDNTTNYTENTWAGCDAAIKVERYIVDRVEVQTQVGGNFILKDMPSDDYSSYSGYFLLNHVNAIDQPGEWAFDRKTKTVYFNVPTNVNINTDILEASIYNSAFSITGNNYITICNLNIVGQNENSFNLYNCSGITVKNCKITYSGINAFVLYNCKQFDASNNRLEDINNNGFNIEESSNCKLFGNTLKRIAVNAGLGQNSNGQYIGISLWSGHDVDIVQNTLDSIGYNGINFFHCYNTLVKNNLVSYACLTKDDGGGIYTWADRTDDQTLMKNNRVIDNIVMNVKGTLDGVFDPDELSMKAYMGYGLYVDDRSHDVLLQGNTSYNCNLGFLYRNAHNVTIRDNIIYKDIQYGLMMRHNMTDFPITNSRIVSNQILLTEDNSYVIWLLSGANDIHTKNVFDSNYLWNPFFDQRIRYDANSNSYLTFRQWQNIGADPHGKDLPLTFQQSGCKTKEEFIFFEYNTTNSPRTITLNGAYRDKDNILITGNITIQPFRSIILFKDNRAFLPASTTPQGPTSLCQGTISSDYTGTGTTQANQYTWKIIPDGAGIIQSSGLNATITWNNLFSGTVQLFYEARNNSTNYYASSPYLEVVIKKKPQQPKTIIGPDTINFYTATSTYSISLTDDQYDWQLSPTEAGTISQNNKSPVTINWNNTFIGRAELIVRTGNSVCGYSEYSAPLLIDIIKLDTLLASNALPNGPIDICQGTSSSNYTTTGNSLATNYTWKLSPQTAGTVQSNGLSSTITWNRTFYGTAYIYYEARNPSISYNAISPTLAISIKNLPQKPLAINGPDTVVFYSPSTQYSINSIAETYQWEITPSTAGNITNSNSNNVDINWDANYKGLVEIRTRIGNSTCGFSDYSNPLRVAIIQLDTVLSASARPQGLTDLCQGTLSTPYYCAGYSLAKKYIWTLSPNAAGTITGSGMNINVNWNNNFFGDAQLSYLAQNENIGLKAKSPALTIHIKNRPVLPQVTGPDTVIKRNTMQTNYLNINDFDLTEWKLAPGSAGSIFVNSINEITINWSNTFIGNAELSVRSTNTCGASEYALLNIAIFDTEPKDTIYREIVAGIPNLFTPNSDGVNDYWIIPFLKDHPEAVINIYDRFNTLVHTQKGTDSPWDGTVNNVPLSIGNYLYIIQLKSPTPPITGYVTILR